jgi:hypothetical protein
MERMTLKAANRRLLCLLGLMIISSIIGLEADCLPPVLWLASLAYTFTANFGGYTLVMFWTSGKS